ncbi:MAG: type II toxin-antitoxin system RelE/ParE family toxin [Planctomycetes bacterium]|nr:type II toxin-antitoxin system RelE/ParE family toxin [Planctomycetota bacterium]MCB9934127.1 type II toxin-antitoxin system RelE/ParE family toxin [Planctomycetota bacterium]
MKLCWSDEILGQLQVIVRDMSMFDPTAAAKWLRGLKQTAKRIASFPNSGRTVDADERVTVRETLYGKYRLFYSVTAAQVEFLYIWHTARQHPGRGLAGEIEDE